MEQLFFGPQTEGAYHTDGRLSSFCTSIQWTRPLDKDGKINKRGAGFYHKVFRCAKDAGMEVFVNLYHFDMPQYLYQRGGWESREVVEAYANYAKSAFTEFAGEIKYWFTFNEPKASGVIAEDGANCIGYHYWAVIDNWSWNNAFKNRYSFVEVRLSENYDRRLKKSADWLKVITDTREIADIKED